MSGSDPSDYQIWVNNLVESTPNTIVLSSQEQDWAGLDVALLRYTQKQVAAPAFANHLIVVHLNGIPHFVSERDGQIYETEVTQGDVSILPAGGSSEWQWHKRGRCDSLHLALETTFIRNVAAEMGYSNPEQIEILNHFAEVGFREGKYLESAKELPSTLGYEAAGVIDAIGSGVSGLEIGERVSTIPAFSMTQYGVYGESAIVPAAAVAHYPEKLSPQEGTAIWMQYITAYGPLVEYGHAQAGNFVLITAASSSVGYAAIQIAFITRGSSDRNYTHNCQETNAVRKRRRSCDSDQ